jgi:hypothetical protein
LDISGISENRPDIFRDRFSSTVGTFFRKFHNETRLKLWPLRLHLLFLMHIYWHV